jgi:hypothetical protein
MLDRVSHAPVTDRSGFPVTYGFRGEGAPGAATLLGRPAANSWTVLRVNSNGLAPIVPLAGQFGLEQPRAATPLMDRLSQLNSQQTPRRSPDALAMGGTPGTATPLGPPGANVRTLWQVNWNGLRLTVPHTAQFGPEQLRAGTPLKDGLLQSSGLQIPLRSGSGFTLGGTPGTAAQVGPSAGNGQTLGQVPWNRATLDVRLAGQCVSAPLRRDPVLNTQFAQPSAAMRHARTDGSAAPPRAQAVAAPSPSGPSGRPAQRQADLSGRFFDPANGRTTRVTQPPYKGDERNLGGYFTVDRSAQRHDISAGPTATARGTNGRAVMQRLLQQGAIDPRNMNVNRTHPLQLGADGGQHWIPTSRSTYADGRSLFDAQRAAGAAADPSRRLRPSDNAQPVAGYRDAVRGDPVAGGHAAGQGLLGLTSLTLTPRRVRNSVDIVNPRDGTWARVTSTGPGGQGVRVQVFHRNGEGLGVATQTPLSVPLLPRTLRTTEALRPNASPTEGPLVQSLRPVQQNARPARTSAPDTAQPMVRSADRSPNETSLPRWWAREQSEGVTDVVASRAALIRDLSTYARSHRSATFGNRGAFDAGLAAGQPPAGRAVGVLRLPGTLKPVNDHVAHEAADRLISSLMGIADDPIQGTPGFDDRALYHPRLGRFAVDGHAAPVREFLARWTRVVGFEVHETYEPKHAVL